MIRKKWLSARLQIRGQSLRQSSDLRNAQEKAYYSVLTYPLAISEASFPVVAYVHPNSSLAINSALRAFQQHIHCTAGPTFTIRSRGITCCNSLGSLRNSDCHVSWLADTVACPAGRHSTTDGCPGGAYWSPQEAQGTA